MRNYFFTTSNILVKGYQRGQHFVRDSHIQILARSKDEAEKKLKSYIAYGIKIGWYKDAN